MATLADTFEKIAADNGANYVSISMNKDQVSANARWLACVQWDGFSREDNNCAQVNGATPEEALRLTLGAMRLLRTPLSDETDPIQFEVAA